MTTSQSTAVVTGASSGIGRATALQLANQGYTVFAGVRPDLDAQSIQADDPNGRMRPLILDITDSTHIERAYTEVEQAVGNAGLSALVNNASVSVAGPVEYVRLERWRRQLDINFFGQVAITQRFLPLIRKARGRIVFVSSAAGRIAYPTLGPYCASKHALEAMADALRLELRPIGIYVSVVEPGAIRTRMMEDQQPTVDAARAEIDDEGNSLYGETMEAVTHAFGEMKKTAIPAEGVALGISRALRDQRPRARYAVGADFTLQIWLRWLLSDRLFEG